MKHIDNLFKDELGSYAETPPPPAWDSLEKRLNERRRRKFPYGWFWYVGVVTCVVLLGASLLWKMTWGVPANNASAEVLASNAIPVSSKQTIGNKIKNTDINNKGKNNVIAANTQNHSKQASKHHNNHTLPAMTTKNGMAYHTSGSHRNNANKNGKNDQIKTTQKAKTNEDLYADEDDDQYTVGYSSNTRKNNASPVETEHGSDYVVEQRSHDHILVAEMAPAQNASTAAYSSSASISASNEKLALQFRNSKMALQTDQAKSMTTQHAQNKTRSQSTPVASRSITHNSTGAKSNENRAMKSVANGKKTKTDVAVSPDVLVSSSSSAKAIREKKAVVLTTNNNKDQAQTKTAKSKGGSGVANNAAIDHVVTGSATAKVNKSDNKSFPKPMATAETIVNANVSSKLGGTKNLTGKTLAMTESKKKDEAAGKTKEIVGKQSSISSPTVTASKSTVALAVDASNKENLKGKKLQGKPAVKAQKSYVSTSDKKNTKTQAAIYQAATTAGVKTNKTATASIKTVHVVNTKSGMKHLISNDKKAVDKVMANRKVNKPVNTLSAAAKTIDAGSIKSGINHVAAKIKKSSNKPGGDTKVSKSVRTSGADPKTTFEKGKVKPVAPVASNAVAKSGIERKEQAGKAKVVTGEQGMPKKGDPVNLSVAKNGDKTAKKAAHKNSSGNSGNNANPIAQKAPVNIFSASFSNRTVADETAMIDNLQVNNFTPEQLHSNSSSEETLAGTFKQPDLKSTKVDSAAINPGAMTDSTAKHKSFFKRFEAGVKAGYETGFVKNSANKFVVSPFVQYNINDKFALLTQPSIKVSSINGSVGTPLIYNDAVKSTGPTPFGSSSAVVIIVAGSSYATIGYIQEYTYSQQYKSIVKSYHYGGNYDEVEFPLLLKYKIIPKLSVYGGADMIYGKYISIKENTSTSGILTKFDTAHVFTPLGQSANQPQSINKVINLPGLPYANYTGSAYHSPSGDLLRMGYMLGFSYEYKKRWLFDVLVQQAMVKPNYEGGTNTNAPLTMPYFRFAIGYKLTK